MINRCFVLVCHLCILISHSKFLGLGDLEGDRARSNERAMASKMEPVTADDFSKYRNISVKAINRSTRKILSMFMDPILTITTESSMPKDWTGLAELMGFTEQHITNFQRLESPTLKLLSEWETKKNATVKNLLEFLQELERFDVLDDEHFKVRLDANIKSYQEYIAEQLSQGDNPLQVEEVDTTVSLPKRLPDIGYNEFENITVGEVESKTPEFFDAFVSYCPADLKYVKLMIKELERPYDLKLCVNARDLLPGTSTHTVSAKLIEERCTRMVMVLTPKFLASPECDFQLKFAQSLSPGSRGKKLVPVLFEPCEIPNVLRHITISDFTREDMNEWAWLRLGRVLQVAPKYMSSEESADRDISNLFLQLRPISSSSSSSGLLESISTDDSSSEQPSLTPSGSLQKNGSSLEPVYSRKTEEKRSSNIRPRSDLNETMV